MLAKLSSTKFDEILIKFIEYISGVAYVHVL